jgi:hypothetical protein
MIAQGAMAFNSRRSPTTCPYSVPQILVTLKPLMAQQERAGGHQNRPIGITVQYTTLLESDIATCVLSREGPLHYIGNGSTQTSSPLS